MINRIPNKIGGLLGKAAIVKTAAQQYGAGIPLVHGTVANIGLDIDTLTAADNSVDAGNTEVKTKLEVLAAILLACRLFIMFGRDMFKPILGMKHSTAYEVIGLVDSGEAPRTAVKVLPVLQKYAAFLTANPQYEDVAHNITAARATSLYNDLLAAQTDVNTKKTELQTLRNTRRTAKTALQKRLRGVLSEMKQLLAPLDPRWTAFGFNKPGAQSIPEVPEGLIATLIGNNAIALKWNSAARTDHYRVYAKINGVDQELIAIGSPSDLDFTIEGLPAATKVEIAVSAVNNGGESQRSEIVTVTTH